MNRHAAAVLSYAGGIVGLAVVGACTAHAAPPSFPDLRGYTPVNSQDYVITYDTPGIAVSGTYFLTPDGIKCTIESSDALCAGNNFPGVPPATPSSGGTPRVNQISTAMPIRATSSAFGTSDTVRDHPIKTLPPNHSIAVDGVICGVNGSGMTACKDPQGHGFILSPQWSGWLPRV